MSKHYERLKTLLIDLFQLDQPELDFGIYRIMQDKRAEITQFLEKDLLPQVKAAFAQYQSADKAAIKQDLDKAIEQARALGADPDALPKVKELRAKLADEAVDMNALEAEVYDHLYSFFRRYYTEGDFLSKRVYKPGVYAIPYEGEEVKLYWTNYDQYYIKTSEYLREYAFRLQPDDEKHPMRVHFRLVDAAEGEHNNVKEQAGHERRFKLAPAPFASLEDGELVIHFTYQPDEAKQKELNGEAEKAILGLTDTELSDWVKELGTNHVRADGTVSDNTRLRVHLDRYTARNTFDYFIHKDLGGFLRRELDFYIKNEVMHLGDVENETAPRVEQYLSKIKVIRRIANKIIDFLAQIEDFQKKLWLKKKFVVETQYCITLDHIFAIEDGKARDWLIEEIIKNEAQREEWVGLCAIAELNPAQGNPPEPVPPGYSVPLKPEFLKAHPTLMVDTRHFDKAFTARLLDAIGDMDEQTDGVLIHSENFQALSLIQVRYRKQVETIYIDPPYNTSENTFVYKNQYRHSSWLTMMHNRVSAGVNLLDSGGVMECAIDDTETSGLRAILDELLGPTNRVATIAVEVNPAGQNLRPNMPALSHDYCHVYARDIAHMEMLVRELTDEEMKHYKGRDTKGAFLWDTLRRRGGNSRPSNRPGQWYPIYVEPLSKQVSLDAKDGWVEMWPIDPQGNQRIWRYNPDGARKEIAAGEISVIDKAGRLEIVKKTRMPEGKKPKTHWHEAKYSSTTYGTKLLINILGEQRFSYPKSVHLVADCLRYWCNDEALVLDYFAGSGTTGHAVININREDGGRRKFILVEMGDYFDTVLLPRLKKVTYTPEWKDGKPKRLATSKESERSPRILKVLRLESYEDTLNNLKLKRTLKQKRLLELFEAQGPDRFKEQYILRYMLDMESRGSPSLLNIAAFTDPTAYTLKVKRPGSDESREATVDLLETFNWLIGLKVQHIFAPHTFHAEFERDGEGRLRLKGRLEPDAAGPWWFRTVTGTTPDGRKTLIIWRKRPGDETPEGIEQDNLVLNEWFTRQGYSSKDSVFDLIYVNGDNNLDNLKAPDDTWKVRLIEEDFFRLMFEMGGID